MALDSEEFQNRRLQRQQRQKEKKRRKIVIFISALVAVAIAIALIVILLGMRSGGEDIAQTTIETTAPPTKVIHLAAAGDLNATAGVINSGGAGYDYTQTFLDVAPVLADADLTVLNFEGNLFGQPYGADFSAPQSLMEDLKEIGVDMVQLANSFSIYKGMEGLAATVNGVRSAGLTPLGAYATADEAKAGKGYTIREVDGIKIAFVAFTKGMDGMALPAGSESCVNVLYSDYASTYQTVDKEGIIRVLDQAKKEKPDLIVAMLHWGSEYNDTISTTQQEITQLMQSQGVDAIIGTHSHFVQKMELNAETGQFVAYSLGDFISEGQRAGTEYSVILDLEITKNLQTGDTKITNYTYTPIFSVHEEGKTLRVLRLETAMEAFQNGYIDRITQESFDAMAYAMERIKARIAGE